MATVGSRRAQRTKNDSKMMPEGAKRRSKMKGFGAKPVSMYRSGAHPNGTFDTWEQALAHMISSCTCRHGGGYGACALDIYIYIYM